MPDPAIEAYNAGLPYSEPPTRSLFGKKRGKGAMASVTLVQDLVNPMAPPRRVVDVDGKKSGWFGRKVGGKNVVWEEKPPPGLFTPSKTYGSRPMPQPTAPSSHSAAQGLTQQPTQSSNAAYPDFQAYQTYPTFQTFQPNLPDAQPNTHPETHPHLLVDPLPPNFWDLPWKERRRLEKMRGEQNKMVREWEKSQRDWEKAQGLAAKRKYKEEMKQKKKDLKAQEKLLKYQRKHPNRSVPTPHPSTGLPNPSPPNPGQSSQDNQKNVKWMMMPTQEEFGVRRPFDASGRLPQNGYGSDWPTMSRTMTHAIVDMGREERVHAVTAGTVWGGGWGGHW